MRHVMSSTFVGLLAVLAAAPQDPPAVRPAPPPAETPTLPPVSEPFRTPVERRDLIQQFTPHSVLEGHFELKRIVANGQQVMPDSQGYAVFGRRHVSIHLRFTDREKVTSVQSGYRRYVVQGNKLVTYALIGHRDEPGEDVVLDQLGLTETREFELLGTQLRIHQATNDYLEFARIE